MVNTPRLIRALRGPTLTCKGWLQEAALRMLMNNLDPEVAKCPQWCTVSGGLPDVEEPDFMEMAIVSEKDTIGVDGDETLAESDV